MTSRDRYGTDEERRRGKVTACHYLPAPVEKGWSSDLRDGKKVRRGSYAVWMADAGCPRSPAICRRRRSGPYSPPGGWVLRPVPAPLTARMRPGRAGQPLKDRGLLVAGRRRSQGIPLSFRQVAPEGFTWGMWCVGECLRAGVVPRSWTIGMESTGLNRRHPRVVKTSVDGRQPGAPRPPGQAKGASKDLPGQPPNAYHSHGQGVKAYLTGRPLTN